MIDENTFMLEKARSVSEVYFAPKLFESERLYKKLGVLFFKEIIPTGRSPYLAENDNTDKTLTVERLREYDLATQRTELVHIVAAPFIAYPSIKIIAESPELYVAVLMLAINVMATLYPIFLQRYNRIRLRKMIAWKKKRLTKNNHDILVS